MSRVRTERDRGGSPWLGGVVAAAMLGASAAAGEETTAPNPGRDLFVRLCAPCHSKDGTAQTPAARKLGVKDLSQSKLTDLQIVQQILEGRQETQDTSKMPAFKDKLTRAEIESLLFVVKEFRKTNTQNDRR